MSLNHSDPRATAAMSASVPPTRRSRSGEPGRARHVSVLLCLLTVGTALNATAAAAQLPPVPPALEEIAFLVGEWEGDGWIEHAPGQRARFRGTERVERRMGGRLVVVEGDFSAWMGPDQGEVPVHQALGIFSYDPARRGLVFRAFTSAGHTTHSAVEVDDRTVVWGYEDPFFGQVRFTISVDVEGRWHEVGYASSDGGASWHRFFEMTLARKETHLPPR